MSRLADDSPELHGFILDTIEAIKIGAKANLEAHGEVRPVGFLLARRLPEEAQETCILVGGTDLWMVMVPVDGGIGKAEYADLLRRLTDVFDAAAVLMVSEAWVVRASPLAPERMTDALDLSSKGELYRHPDKVEEVILIAEGVDGTNVLWSAAIDRAGERPRLGEWKRTPGTCGEGTLTGFLRSTRERAAARRKGKSN